MRQEIALGGAREELREARKAGLRFPEKEPEGMTEQLHKVLQRALALIDRDRFGGADEFIGALRGEGGEDAAYQARIRCAAFGERRCYDRWGTARRRGRRRSPACDLRQGRGQRFCRRGGNGEVEAAAAGESDQCVAGSGAGAPNIVWRFPTVCCSTALRDAARPSSPKFAEETGFNYTVVKSSDLASIYIHGSQQMIRETFRRGACQGADRALFR